MKVYGVGRLTKDMDINYSASGICVIKFSLAENIYNYKTKETEAEFYDCVAFGKLAERKIRQFKHRKRRKIAD